MSPPPAAASPTIHPRRTVDRPEIGPGRPLSAPAPRPRRVSGPARRPITDKPARRRSEGQTGIALGLIAALESLSRHQLLDRLTNRGRTWIALVAFALIGIVTLQLGLLKLNAGIGRALEHEALLQRENAALSIENSELAAGDRVQARAAQMGMQFVPPGTLRFLAARPRTDATRGAVALSTPAHTSTTGTGEGQVAGPGTAAPAGGAAPTAEPPTTASTSQSAAESPGTTSKEAKATAPESTTAAAPPSGTAAGGSSSETAPAGQTQTSPAGGGAPTSPAGGTQTGPAG